MSKLIKGKVERVFVDPEEKRADAVAAAMEALGIEPVYTNHYHCDDCGVSWIDQWSCAVDDECPKCGKDISPHDWECDWDEKESD
jgi:rubrerythrin